MSDCKNEIFLNGSKEFCSDNYMSLIMTRGPIIDNICCLYQSFISFCLLSPLLSDIQCHVL